jgi:hypothetical protein
MQQKHAGREYHQDQEHEDAVRDLIDKQKRISGPRRAADRAILHHLA